MGDEESIGSLGIDLGLNFPGLQADIDSAVALVQAQGSRFGDALNSALQGADASPITQAFAASGTVIADIAKEIANAIPSALAAPDTTMVTQALSSVSAAAHDAQEILSGISVDISAPDISGAQDAFSALTADAQQASQSVANDFATALAAPDTGTFSDSLNNLVQVAAEDARQISTDLSGIAAQGLDATPITDSLNSIDAAAQTAGQALANDLSASLQPLDASPIDDSLSTIVDAAKSAGDAISTDLATSVQPMDVTPITDSLASIDAAAQSDMEAMQAYFTDAPLAPPDDSQVLAALSSIDDQAAGAVAAMESDFANLAVPAPDIAPVADAIKQLDDNAVNGQAALQDLIDKFRDGEITAKEYSSAANALASAMEAIGQKAAEVGPEFDGIANSAAKYSAAAQDIVDKQNAADGALLAAQGALSEIQSAYEKGAVDADTLARAAQNLQSSFDQANPAIKQAQQNTQDASIAAEAAQTAFGGLVSILGALGVSLSLAAFVNFAEDVGSAADAITRTNISLTALTGDAEQAATTIEKLDQLGISDGLSMPGLQQAAVTMTNLLPAGADVVGILSQIADAAAITGKSFDTVASAFDRLASGGNTGIKQLLSLGINLDSLKTTMNDLGIAAEGTGKQILAAFNLQDVHDKIVIAQTAMEKFQGVAQDVAQNTFGGAWKSAMAQWDTDIGIIQKDLGSIIGDLGGDLRSGVTFIAEAFVVTATTIVATIDGIRGSLKELSVELQSVGQAASLAGSGNFAAAGAVIAGMFGQVEQIEKQTQDKITADWAVGTKIVLDLESQKTAAIKPTIDALDHQGASAKSAALSMAQAEAAVQSFDTTALAGAGTVGTLQAAFENTSKAITLLSKADLPEVTKALMDYITVQGQAGASTNVLATGMDALDKALNQTGKTDATAAAEGFALLTKDLLDIGGNALPLVAAAFNNTEKQIASIAKDAPDAALEIQNAFNAILTNSGASPAILNDAFTKTDAIIKQIATQDAPQAVGAFITLAGTMKDAGDSVQLWSKPLTDAQATLVTLEKSSLPDAATGFGILAQSMIDLHAPAQLVTDTFNLQLAAFQKMAAGGDITGAVNGINGLVEAEIKAGQQIPEVDKAFQAQQDIFTKMAAAGQFQGAIDGFNKLADAEKAFNPTGTEFVKTLDAERAALDLMAGQGGTGLTTAIGLLGQLAQKQLDLQAPSAEVTKTLDDERSKIDALAGQGGAGLTQAISLLSNLADEQVKLNQPTADVTKTLDDERSKIVGLGASNVPAAIEAIKGLVAQQIALKQPTDDVNASLKVQSDLLAKEVNTDLPAAIAAHQQYLDQLNKENSLFIAINAEGAKTVQQQQFQISSQQQLLDSVNSVNLAYGDRLAIEAKIAQEEINLGTAQGQNVEAQIWGLEKIKLAQDALVISTHGWADSETQALNDGIKGFENMGQSMANVIVNGGNMADAIVADLKKIAATILTDLIDGGLKQLAGALIGLVTGVPAAMTTITTGIGGVSAASTAAASGLTALGTAATAAATAISAAATAQASSSTAVAAAAGGEAAAMAAEVGADTAQTAAAIADTSATVSDTAAQIADAAATGGEAAAMIAEAGTVVADTAATTADAAAKTADSGATIADTASTIADTGATIGQTAADIADTASVIADATAQAADTVATIAETAATIADTVAQIAFASVVSAIAGIVGAIAGIVGDVYLHAIDEKLFSIETSTNRTANDLANLRADQWSQYGDMYDRLGEIEQDTHTMLATLQAMYGVMQGGGGTGGGGLGPSAQADLDAIASNTNGLMTTENAMAANINAMAGYEQTMAPALSAIEQYAGQIYDFLSVMDKDINAITSAILYGGGLQTNSMESMSLSMQAMARGPGGAPSTGGAIPGGGTDPRLPGLGGAGAPDTSTAAASLAAAQASAAAALTIANEITALQKEIAADNSLMDQAIKDGNFALAATYQQAAENATRELAPYLSATNTGLAQVNTSMSNTTTAIRDADNHIVVEASQGAFSMVGAVNANTETITKIVTPGNLDTFVVSGYGQGVATISQSIYGAAAQTGAAFQAASSGLSGGSIPYTPGRSNERTGPGSGGSTPTAYGSPGYVPPDSGTPDTGTQGAGSGGPLGTYNPGGTPTGVEFDSAGYVIGSAADIAFQAVSKGGYGGIPGAYAPPSSSGAGSGFNAPPPPASSIITPPPAGTVTGPALEGTTTGPGAKAPVSAVPSPTVSDMASAVAAAVNPNADRIAGDQAALALQLSLNAPPAMIDLLRQTLAKDQGISLAPPTSSTGSTSISGTIAGTVPMGTNTDNSVPLPTPSGPSGSDQITRAIANETAIIDGLKSQAADLTNQITAAVAAGDQASAATFQTSLGSVNSSLGGANTILSEIQSTQTSTGPATVAGLSGVKATADQMVQAQKNAQASVDTLSGHMSDLNQQLIIAESDGNNSLVQSLQTQIGTTNTNLNSANQLLSSIDANTLSSASSGTHVADNTALTPATIKQAITNEKSLIDGLTTHLTDLHTELVNALAGGDQTLVNTIIGEIGQTNSELTTDTGILNQIGGSTASTAANTAKSGAAPAPPPSGVGPGSLIGNLAYSGLRLGYSYQSGGQVPTTGWHHLEANEWVIPPPPATINLPADVIGRIGLPAPIPVLSGGGGGFGGGSAATPGGAQVTQHITLNVNGLTINDVVRQVPALMKQLSPALAGRNY